MISSRLSRAARRLVGLVALGSLGLGCTPAPVRPRLLPLEDAYLPVRPVTAAKPPQWLSDDLEGATARAREAGALLLVDAWAPWCHTCLSMKRHVLSSPSLGTYEGRVVFAALDTDRASSAAFVGRYAVEVWPTFFVIDPANDRVLAVHGGSASLEELRAVLDGALALRESGGGGQFEEALLAASTSYAERRFVEAGVAYLRAAAFSHPRASEAYLGAIRSFSKADDTTSCADVAGRWVETVAGSAMAADFCYHARECALKLRDGAPRRELLDRVRKRLRALTEDPHPGSTVDDRADALAMLAEAERDGGDDALVRAAIERRVALLDAAATAATSPREAAVYDYLRMRAYEDVGRPEAAIAMLDARTRQMPSDYEPFARLASVLAKTDPRRALEPLRRAIELSYGPRQIRYLEQKAEIHVRLGDMPGVLETRRRIIDALTSLPPGQADAAHLERAKVALAAALAEEKEMLAPGPPAKGSPGAGVPQGPSRSPAGPPPRK